MHTHIQIPGRKQRLPQGIRALFAARSMAKRERRLRKALKAVRRQAASLERRS